MAQKRKADLIIGQRFGHWEIIGPAQIIDTKTHYPVRCDCGLEVTQLATYLRTGKTYGCQKCQGYNKFAITSPKTRMRKRIVDPEERIRHRNPIGIGQKIGWWTVIGPEFYMTGNYFHKAQCRCGAIRDKPSSKLRLGRLNSCKQCLPSYRRELQQIKIQQAVEKAINPINSTAEKDTNMKWLKIIDYEPKMNQKCVFTTIDKHVFEGIFLYKYDDDLYGFFRNKISAETFTSIKDVTHWIDINNFFDVLLLEVPPNINILSSGPIRIAPPIIQDGIDDNGKIFKNGEYKGTVHPSKIEIARKVLAPAYPKKEKFPAERKRTPQSEEFREFARALKVGERFKKWVILEGPMDIQIGKRVNIYYKCKHDLGHEELLRACDLINDRIREQ